MESGSTVTAEERRQAKTVLIKAAVVAAAIAALIVAGIVACTSSLSGSAVSQCRDLVVDRYGGDNRFVEVTFTDGDFIKGTISQYLDGDESRYGHWECTVTDGEAEIAFVSQG